MQNEMESWVAKNIPKRETVMYEQSIDLPRN
jgi:hypothetical protein